MYTAARHYKAMERLFAAEINGKLPLQSRAKVYRELEEMELAQPLEQQFGYGAFAVTVRGWQLTHRGRLLCCSDCASEKP